MPASRCLSLDETIEMGSSIYASDIYQYVKGKRHDWGILIRKISGSSREVLGLEYHQLSEEDRDFVGAGWCRAAHVEPGKKYYKPKTFEYNGKGYAIFMHLVLNFNWYVHQGFCFFLDGYFTRNPIALLDFAKKMGMNVSGTVRNDARNLPEERNAVREEVRISKFFIIVTYSYL